MVNLLEKSHGVGVHFARLSLKQQRDLETALTIASHVMQSEASRGALKSDLHTKLDFCEWCSIGDRIRRLVEVDGL